MLIPFNKPYIPLASFVHIIRDALSGSVAGNGKYTKKCHGLFERQFGFAKVLMTTSCTDALEMTAFLAGIGPGDEVIVPSFAYMSDANAFLARGAGIVFADTLGSIPNIDPDEIDRLITPKTKAILVVHYAGQACEMDRILKSAADHGLFVIEDAAHAIGSYYRGKPLGTLGDFGTISFHETKNIISGEGGLLIVNDTRYSARAEILWEKGTDRVSFSRGEKDKYRWVDIGSSYLPPDLVAAMLYPQVAGFQRIQSVRKRLWWNYYNLLKPLEEQGFLKCPVVPGYATVNGNMFYITLESRESRDGLMAYLKKEGVTALFHYLPLHSSPYFAEKHDGRRLPNADRFSATILRLPFYNSLQKSGVKYIVSRVRKFFLGGKQSC